MEVLKSTGAEFVVSSFLPSFKEDLLAAVTATEATVALDATGGGTLAMVILTTFDTSLRQLYPDQVHPAHRPAMGRTVCKYGGLDKWNSEFLPSVGVEQIVDAPVLLGAEEVVDLPQERISECIAKQIGDLQDAQGLHTCICKDQHEGDQETKCGDRQGLDEASSTKAVLETPGEVFSSVEGHRSSQEDAGRVDAGCCERPGDHGQD